MLKPPVPIFAPDNIFEFKLGTVVFDRNYRDEQDNLVEMVGHIVGFALNEYREVVLRVEWADGNTSIAHPARIHLQYWK